MDNTLTRTTYVYQSGHLLSRSVTAMTYDVFRVKERPGYRGFRLVEYRCSFFSVKKARTFCSLMNHACHQ